MTAEEILERYPGLRKNMLMRASKKAHLYDMRQKHGWSSEDIEKILDELYPQKEQSQ